MWEIAHLVGFHYKNFKYILKLSVVQAFEDDAFDYINDSYYAVGLQGLST